MQITQTLPRHVPLPLHLVAKLFLPLLPPYHDLDMGNPRQGGKVWIGMIISFKLAPLAPGRKLLFQFLDGFSGCETSVVFVGLGLGRLKSRVLWN